jgi:ATP-binding protein involved in chromosome partitioning
MGCSNESGACTSGGCATSGMGSLPGSISENGNELQERMGKIKHKILVLSGKGGVGKSTVAANLACSLSLKDFRTGLLDVDFHGPSIPTLLHLEGQAVYSGPGGLVPIEYNPHLKVMSLGFILRNQDDAVIWRGPMKMQVMKQLLEDVLWGTLDYLVMDFPPGTGDEPLSMSQLIPDVDGAVIVTTPQNLSLNDVRKSINFCHQVKVPVLGVIENMSGFICPHCQGVVDIFKKGGGEAMAERMGVSFLGRIPMTSLIVEASDDGRPFIEKHQSAEASRMLDHIVDELIVKIDGNP